MSSNLLVAPYLVGVLALVTAAGTSCGRRPEALEDVVARLPAALGELRASGDDATYQPAQIFSYLDGGAEVYLAYNLVACHARRYTGPAGEVTVDLFDMGSSADAFGVFSRDLDGDSVGVGQGARVRANWLSAWKGRFLVSVTADSDDEAGRRAVLDLGRAVAACIRNEGPLPELTTVLPPDGLDRGRLAFLHDHVTLASHVQLPDGNPLALSRATEVAIGRYRRGDAVATLLLVRYPAAEAAGAAAGALAEAWATAPGVTVRDGAGLWRAVTVGGRHVAAVLAGNDEGTVHVLLAEALSRSAGD